MSEPMRPRIFLHELYWDFRSRNQDWRYVRFTLPQLAEYEADLEFTTETSRLVALAGNWKAVRGAIERRLGFRHDVAQGAIGNLSTRELRASGCNVIFARAFPLNAGDVPVVWEGGLVDREMHRAWNVSEEYIAEEDAVRGALFRRAKVIKLFAEVERVRHALAFPDIAERFVAVPWFAPHVRACERENLEKHHHGDPVRILFVGNHAFRKGLDQLIEAFLKLPASSQERSLLTIVSNFDRSSIAVPDHERITVLRGASREKVMEEMRRAHIFANVARFESYGVVFHEAMSQGAACLAPNWEVQREFFENGVGLNLECNSDAISVALDRLIHDEEYRYHLGVAAWERFQERYAPAVVAERYANLFRDVVGR